MNKNKRHVFFIRAESHIKGVKIFLEKKIGFFFQSEYRQNYEK